MANLLSKCSVNCSPARGIGVFITATADVITAVSVWRSLCFGRSSFGLAVSLKEGRGLARFLRLC